MCSVFNRDRKQLDARPSMDLVYIGASVRKRKNLFEKSEDSNEKNN